MRIATKGATSQSIYVTVQDSTSTTGGKKTGLVFNTASLTAYYCRNGAAAVQITLATLAAANSAWSSGGFKEVDATNMPGLYRLDVPDAAFASGAESVVITLKGATGMAQVDDEVQLLAVNLQDAVRAGLTALPNANAGANGGLPTGDASGRVTVASIANGVIAAATFAANALDAVWATGTRRLTDGTNIALAKGTGVTGFNDLDATAVATATQTGLTAQGYTSTRAGYLDTLSGLVAAIWANGTRTLTAEFDSSGVTTLLSRIASALTITGGKVDVNDKTGFALTAAYDPAKTAAQAGDAMTLTSAYDAAKTAAQPGDVPTTGDIAAAVLDPPMADHLGAGTVGDAIFQAGVHAPSADSKLDAVQTSLDAIDAKTTNLPADPAATSDLASLSSALSSLDAAVAAVKAKTDNLPLDPADQSELDSSLNELETLIDGIKAKTDQFTIDADGIVAANVKKVNDVDVIGVGTEDNPWNPAP